MTTEEVDINKFLPASDELLASAPEDSWIAVSSDGTRIVAAGKDLNAVIAQADALGEQNYVLDKTPPAGAMFVF